jgi:hypothetical protein
MFSGPSCPICPFSMELGRMEINTQVQGTLAPRINLNLGSGPVPLRERVDNLWMSLLGMALCYLYQSPFLNVSIPMQGLGHARSTPWRVSLPQDVVRQEARGTYRERLRSQRQWRWVEGNT